MATTFPISAQPQQATDGRRWILRAARPSDGQPLAALFAAVRAEGRWLVTPAAAVSHASEAFFIGELIRDPRGLALVAEAEADIVGNVLVSVDRNRVTEHIGTLSICVADGWREVGIGRALVAAAQGWARAQGLAKVALAVFADNPRAIAVYQHAGFVSEGLRRRQYRADDGSFRDELLMAWFPQPTGDAAAIAVDAP